MLIYNIKIFYLSNFKSFFLVLLILKFRRGKYIPKCFVDMFLVRMMGSHRCTWIFYAYHIIIHLADSKLNLSINFRLSVNSTALIHCKSWNGNVIDSWECVSRYTTLYVRVRGPGECVNLLCLVIIMKFTFPRNVSKFQEKDTIERFIYNQISSYQRSRPLSLLTKTF